MESTAVLYFLSNGVKLHFYSLGSIFEENMRGVQRGAAPWLWVSNRGEKHPCWHTILLAKSSVLYLLRPLTLERGCPTPDRHCSGVVGIGNLVAVWKDLLCQRGRKRYIKAAAAIIPRTV